MRVSVFSALCMVFLSTFAQELRTVEGEYTYQYSDNETIVQARESARNYALTDAVSKFATYIESRSVVEDYVTKKETIISTAMGFVQNVKIIDQNEDRTRSQIYMKVSCELNEEKVIDLLKKSATPEDSYSKEIGDFIDLAVNAEKENRVADALKYYYWALVLFRNDKNQKSTNVPEFNGMSITVAVPDRINRILSELDITVDEINDIDESRTVRVKTTRKQQNLENLDFKYYQIDGWSPLVSSKGGYAEVELSEAEKSQSKIRIAIEYAYRDRASFDPELEHYLANAKITFSNTERTLDLGRKILNNISEIKKDFPFEPVKDTSPAPLVTEPEIRSSKKWWYIGGGAAVLAGVGVVLLMSEDEDKDTSSADVDFNITLP